MTEAATSSMVAVPGLGMVSNESLANARDSYARAYVAKDGETADAIAAGRAARAAQFDAAAAPGSSGTASAESPEVERAFQNLLAFGMTPAAVQEVRTSKAASPAEAEMARVWKAQFMRDAEKQKKYFAGDPEVGKQFLACNFILSLPVKQPAK